MIFKNGCWWTKSSCCSYIVLILRNAEESLSAGCFIHDRPFTSSKVELIMSAWKERNEANRCKNYVEHVVPTYTLDEFQQHFRLKRGTFEILITNTNVITAIFLFCDSIQIISDLWFECFRIMFLFRLNKTTNHKPDLGKKNVTHINHFLCNDFKTVHLFSHYNWEIC